MKKLILIFLLASLPVATFAADADGLVTLSPANVCYNATLRDLNDQRGIYIVAISSQVPCSEKAAKPLRVMHMVKKDVSCLYTIAHHIGGYDSVAKKSNFFLTARCPTDKK